MSRINKGVRQLVADAASQIAGNYCRAGYLHQRRGDDLLDFPNVVPKCKQMTEQISLFEPAVGCCRKSS